MAGVQHRGHGPLSAVSYTSEPPISDLPLLILLHGLGGNGKDFGARFAPFFLEKGWCVWAPTAPSRETIFFDMRGQLNAWFQISLKSKDLNAMMEQRFEGILEVEALLLKAVSGRKRVAVFGHSMGACMALFLGLRNVQFETVVAAHGFFPPWYYTVEGECAYTQVRNPGARLLCTSDTRDRVVPYKDSKDSFRYLMGETVYFQTQDTPVKFGSFEDFSNANSAHHIGKEELKRIVEFVGS